MPKNQSGPRRVSRSTRRINRPRRSDADALSISLEKRTVRRSITWLPKGERIVKYARKESTKIDGVRRRGLRKEIERRPRSSEVRYCEDVRRDDHDREYKQLDRRRRERSRQREPRTVNRPRRPNERIIERRPCQIRSRSVEYRTALREEPIRRSKRSPIRKRDGRFVAGVDEDDYKIYSKEQRSTIVSPYRKRQRYKPRIRSLSREKRRSNEEITRPRRSPRNVSRERERSPSRNHSRERKQLRKVFPLPKRDRSSRERRLVRETSPSTKRYRASRSVEPYRNKRDKTKSYGRQLDRIKRESKKQPNRSLSREERKSQDRGRPRVQERSQSRFLSHSIEKRQSGRVRLSSSRARYRAKEGSEPREQHNRERSLSKPNALSQVRSQSRSRSHVRDVSKKRGDSLKRSPYENSRPSRRRSESKDIQRSKERSKSRELEESRTEKNGQKTEHRKQDRSQSRDLRSPSRSFKIQEQKHSSDRSHSTHETEKEGLKESCFPEVDIRSPRGHLLSRERSTSKSLPKSQSPDKNTSRSRSPKSIREHPPGKVQNGKEIVKIESESDSSEKLQRKKKRSKKRRKKKRRKSKRRRKRSKKSIWSKLTSVERAAIPSSERAAMKKRAREEESASSSEDDKEGSSSTGSRSVSKSSTPQRKRRRRHRRRKLRAMRELLGHSQIPVIALAAAQPVVKKQVRHGSGMVFDGFNWYPKGSQEAMVTQKKIAMKQPMYGPNGSRANSGMGLATPINGQRMATQAIAELIAKKQWVV